MTVQEQRNCELARSVFDAFARNDMELFHRLLDAEAEVRIMGETASSWMRKGQDLIEKKSRQEPNEPWVYNIYYMTAQNDRVAVEVESLHRVGEQKKLYNNRYHFLFGFKNDKIVLWHEYSDTAMASRVLYDNAAPKLTKTDAERIREFYERRAEWGQDDGSRPVL